MPGLDSIVFGQMDLSGSYGFPHCASWLEILEAPELHAAMLKVGALPAVGALHALQSLKHDCRRSGKIFSGCTTRCCPAGLRGLQTERCTLRGLNWRPRDGQADHVALRPHWLDSHRRECTMTRILLSSQRPFDERRLSCRRTWR